MKRQRALLMLGSLWLLAGMMPAQATGIVIGNLGFEKIPTGESRRVLGTWFLQKLGCTRSIEEVGERYFMVSRCPGKAEDGDGLPLRKLSDVWYEGKTTGWTYRILDSGALLMRSARGSEWHGEPHHSLWP